MRLREICTVAKVSRRAVQGYEKAGLVAPSGRTNRGYLLYDEIALERVKKIKLFQDLGFQIKEIKEIIDAPNEILRATLEKQVERLKERNAQVEQLIRKAYELMEQM